MTKRDEIRAERMEAYQKTYPYMAPETVNKMFDRIANAVDAKCPKDLESLIGNTDNLWSRATFTALTGHQLPRTRKGSIEVIRLFVGPENFDAYRAAEKEAFEVRRQQEEDQRLAERRKLMLAERIAWMTGEPRKRVEGTIDGLIDYLVSECESFAEIKQGFSLRYYINLKDGRCIKLSRKDWFEEFSFRLALKNAGITDESSTVQ